MAMPALQAFRRANSPAHVTVLVKPPLAPLWRLNPAVDDLIDLHEGFLGTIQTVRAVRAVRAAGAGAVYVLPNSIRAALVPWFARVPARVGLRGDRPPGMLTQVVTPPADVQREHQAWEYMAVFGADAREAKLERPMLRIAETSAPTVLARLGGQADARWIGVLPGAAYGPAKRWPAEHFAAAALALAERVGGRVAVMGSRGETAVCALVVAGIGARAVNLAGATTLPELAAVLAQCAVVLCNDSGGMHLAAAMGAPVVAVFGITDPRKTGPLGARCRVVCAPGVQQSRDLERDSAEARQALAAILPERVVGEAGAVMQVGRA